MPWQLQQAEALASQPQPNAEEVAQVALALADFLEQAPTDFLEALLSSPFGRVYELFLDRCCKAPLPAESIEATKQRLTTKLRSFGFQGGEGHGMLLALMPLFPPGSLKVEDAPAKLPGWLLALYRRRYEPVSASVSSTPDTAGQESSSGAPSLSGRIFLNRMLGLSNLYYIDPDDQEILQELRQVRLQTVELLLSNSSQALGEAFCADFGDRYWAMAQSGIQKEALDAHEVQQRDAIQQWLTTTPQSLSAEGGIQRFAAALLFSQPGSVKLAEPERNLPAWFVEGFKRFSSMPTG
jgi:hypothetical protein